MKSLMQTVLLAICTGLVTTVVIAQSPREQLQQLTIQLQQTPNDNALRERIIKLAVEIKPAPAIPEEVDRRMVRGAVAFKSATSASGYQDAAKEYEQATLTAPWYGDAYYNLGVAQDKAGNYKATLRSLKLALLTSPDSKEMKALIYEVEYRDEKENSPEAQAAREKEAEQRFVASLEGAKYVCREIRDVDGGRRRVEIDIINGQITTANVTTWLGSEPSKNDYVGFRGSWSPNMPIRGKVNQVVTKQDDLRVEIYEDRLVFKRVYVGMAFGDTCPRIN